MMTNKDADIRTLDALVEPLRRLISEQCPALCAESVTAFAVQIALAEQRAEERVLELYHLFGGRSSN